MENLQVFQILRFSLQPILENSVQHGCVMGVPLHIGVRAVIEREKNRFVLSVENDGKEIPPEKLEGLRERIAQARESLPEIRDRGVGMVNLMRRLELNYGKDADMSLTSADGRTCFELVLPLNQCEREEGTDEFSGGGR